MEAWPDWEGAHKPQAPEGPGPLCPVPLPPPPNPEDFEDLAPSSLEEQDSLEEAQRLWPECPAEAEGALPGPAS